MCRVAVRNARRRSAESERNVEQEEQFLGMDALPEVKAEIDFNQLFAEEDEVDLDADLRFLDMFNTNVAPPSTAPDAVAEAPKINAVLGQPMDATTAAAAYAQPAMVVPAMQPQITIAQALPNGIMNPAAYAQPGAAAALHQQYTQVILQQHMLAQLQQQAQAPAAGSMPVNKRGKTAAEIAEQQERIKRRRRESAQRSRQRKSAYMKSLECENAALKAENDNLRKELARLGRNLPPMFNSNITTSGSSAGLDQSDPAASSDVGLCPVDISGLGSNAAQELMGMVI